MAVRVRITSIPLMFLLLCSALLATTLQGVQGEVEVEGPSESECRPHIEKALKKLETGDTQSAEIQDDEIIHTVTTDDSETQSGEAIESIISKNVEEEGTKEENTGEIESTEVETAKHDGDSEQTGDTKEESVEDKADTGEETDTASEEREPQTKESAESLEKETSVEEQEATAEKTETDDQKSYEEKDATSAEAEAVSSIEQEQVQASAEEDALSVEQEVALSTEDAISAEQEGVSSVEDTASAEREDATSSTEQEKAADSTDEAAASTETETAPSTEDEHSVSTEQGAASVEDTTSVEQEGVSSIEEAAASAEQEAVTSTEDSKVSAEQDSAVNAEQDTAASLEQEDSVPSTEEEKASTEQEGDAASAEEATGSVESTGSVEETTASVEEATASTEEATSVAGSTEAATSIEQQDEAASVEVSGEKSKNEVSAEQKQGSESTEQTDAASTEQTEEAASVEKEVDEKKESVEGTQAEKDSDEKASAEVEQESTEAKQTEEEVTKKDEAEPTPEEDLTWEVEIPSELRPRDHINEILNLNDKPSDSDSLILKAAEKTLNELKRIYENAIKPLETLYKYRDLSNRHFGDPEIFSKPLVLFMGPWSGGKSSIINYLLDNEYTQTSLRTGAEPSPAYFNLLMWGEEPEVLDGTQLAADWTFSGLQKFGQGLEERLRGLKLPNKLLEKINIVEIPGILEVRKQVSRIFPFNDACQWFIDRADIIFLVYDPSKLDVGPETEAILDQLKGREYQTRIILNKADQVKPEELMRVQGALIWNISPLMSSAQPPVMYSTSLWSRPYEIGAPVRLLHAQERAFLKDLKTAVDKRIENKIASARRFAVRVRNHAKMVDCYLTTYYNHKSVFGNKKLVADQIIEHPQDYHIYEGLSTLTNISRYDLPDPDVYRDFFRLNPLYDFQQLSATCTYFRGCPINRLDVAIAYDLPELVGKYKRMVESATNNNSDSSTKS